VDAGAMAINGDGMVKTFTFAKIRPAQRRTESSMPLNINYKQKKQFGPPLMAQIVFCGIFREKHD